jgi:CBS domain-containing protein
VSPRIVPDVVAPGRVTTLPPTASVMEAAHRMLEEGVSVVAVVDDDGRLLGVVGVLDLLRLTTADGAAALVADVMDRQPDVLAPGDRVLDALDLMLVRGLGALPVVADGRVVALLGALDLAKAIRAQADIDLRARHAEVFGSGFGD